MLMVSSTEPCTLASCDPPQVLRPPSNLIERTLPPRPILHMPVQGRTVFVDEETGKRSKIVTNCNFEANSDNVVCRRLCPCVKKIFF